MASYFGAILPATFNAATIMGFLILECVLGGQTLASTSNGRIGWNVGIIVIAVVSLFVSRPLRTLVAAAD